MSARKQRGIAGDKTICLLLAEGTNYDDVLVPCHSSFRAGIDCREYGERPRRHSPLT